MFVRTAGERDLEAIKALLAETWQATYTAIYGARRVDAITAQWHSVSSLKTQLTHPHSEFLVADDGVSIAGMAFAAATDGDSRVVWLRQLYVLPQRQGEGIGTMLLDEVERCFPEARTLRLEVEKENVSALGFYRARGLTDTDTQSGQALVQDGVAILVLEKPLA